MLNQQDRFLANLRTVAAPRVRAQNAARSALRILDSCLCVRTMESRDDTKNIESDSGTPFSNHAGPRDWNDGAFRLRIQDTNGKGYRTPGGNRGDGRGRTLSRQGGILWRDARPYQLVAGCMVGRRSHH